MKTFAFKNSQKYWSTRYSFTARNYATLDRDMFTSPGGREIYKHGPDADKNTFFGQAYGSSINFTFNNDPGQNKIYKNISLEGSFGAGGSNVSGSFKANDSTDSTQARPSVISSWKEKGAHIHATLSSSVKSGRANIEPVGVFRRAHQIFHPKNLDALKDLINGEPDNPTLDAFGPFAFPMGMYESFKNADIDYNGIFDIDNLWKSPFESRYLFFEIDFFPGYRGSSKKVKYIIEGSGSGAIQDFYGQNFASVNDLFVSDKKICQYAFNKGTLDFRKKTYNSDTGQYDVDIDSALSVDGTSKKGGILVYTNADIQTGSADVFGDFDFDGNVGVSDLLLLLTAYGYGEGESLFDAIFDSNDDGNIGVSDILAFLSNFGQQDLNVEERDISDFVNDLNSLEGILSESLIVYAVTPTSVNGEAARGNYADVSLSFSKENPNFELDVVNLDYEPTQLDHSR